ncbi:unnamed protein product [Pedinophyceae sp. YPF-701]|nr:unnamed protein product [Pedinophyceae sp. YPF-701]
MSTVTHTRTSPLPLGATRHHARPRQQTTRPCDARFTARPRDAAVTAAYRDSIDNAGVGRVTDIVRTDTGAKDLGSAMVDPDLWYVLELASDDDLDSLRAIVFGSSPFSPLLKSLMAKRDDPGPAATADRRELMLAIERRVRFLAADGVAIARRSWPSYREALVAVRDRLGVQCSKKLATGDLEAELFLFMAHTHYEAEEKGREAISNISPSSEEATAGDADGSARPRTGSKTTGWRAAVTEPLRHGSPDIVDAVVKIGAATAVSGLGREALKRLAGQVLARSLTYELVLGEAVRRGASEAALRAAGAGASAAAARYSAARAVSSILGPAMWAALGVDLALKASGTDYGRLTRAVFVLAQIRLVKTYGFTGPEA